MVKQSLLKREIGSPRSGAVHLTIAELIIFTNNARPNLFGARWDYWPTSVNPIAKAFWMRSNPRPSSVEKCTPMPELYLVISFRASRTSGTAYAERISCKGCSLSESVPA